MVNVTRLAGSRFLIIPLGLLLSSCGGGGGGSDDDSNTSGATNTTASTTCYDVQVSYSGTSNTHEICTTKENGGYNGLGVNRFLRFSLSSSALVQISATRTSGLNPADPDLYLVNNGVLLNTADTTTSNRETMSASLAAGNYVVELAEYNYQIASNKITQVKNDLSKREKSREVIMMAPPSNTSSCSRSSESTVDGTVTFERVNHLGSRLNYSDVDTLFAQGVVVEIICNGQTYNWTVTNSVGDYSLVYPNNLSSFVRVRAQTYQSAFDSWDFTVVDNYTGDALYVMDNLALLTSGSVTRDLDALYSNRSAAPFAILDSVRKAVAFVTSSSTPGLTFPALELKWSVNNSTSSDSIGTSFYDGTAIYLLGAENDDTEEFDEHVIIHEWGHYFEDKFSRSDSIGGPHTLGDILDIRVAFGEGFGNAFAAMVTGDAVYKDSSGFNQASGFSINIESNNCTNPGWFSECSVQSILYDLFDSNSDGLDAVSLGFTPLYNVLIDEQRDTSAVTSIFSFITPLKAENGASAGAIDSMIGAQNIDPITDIFGDSELTNNPGSTDQLPVFEAF